MNLYLTMQKTLHDQLLAIDNYLILIINERSVIINRFLSMINENVHRSTLEKNHRPLERK